MLSQKSLISEAKLRIRGIAKEIADLKREKLYLGVQEMSKIKTIV
jgi:hypothetical protein